MEILLALVPMAVVGGGVWTFKRLWPTAPEAAAAGAGSLLGSTRPITTGQIARGVFWGMWLFLVSQIILAAVAMFVMFWLSIALSQSLL